jgi:hypothetical protein
MEEIANGFEKTLKDKRKGCEDKNKEWKIKKIEW